MFEKFWNAKSLNNHFLLYKNYQEILFQKQYLSLHKYIFFFICPLKPEGGGELKAFEDM